MKVLIELPTWMGDTVMSTPAIEMLFNHFSDIEISLIGALPSIELFRHHPNISKIFILNRNLFHFLNEINNFEEFDVFLTFRSSYRSKFMKFCIRSRKKYQFNKQNYIGYHQVEKYYHFVSDIFKIESHPEQLVIYKTKTKKKNKNKLLGINPGASYGSAKRWYPREFAKVAFSLSNDFDIVIFGGSNEKDIAKDIESCLIEHGILNYKNLADKTNIEELVKQISKLDLLITGDSGPMHLAAAFQIPTVAIFGPTRDDETSQWMNEKSVILKKSLDCQPCMKRSCPLNHHNCMKQIRASDVLIEIDKLC
jgi:heptosyltransferase-2